MNLDEFKSSDGHNSDIAPAVQKNNVKKLSINDISSLDTLENQLREKFSLNNSIIEVQPLPRFYFFMVNAPIQIKKY